MPTYTEIMQIIGYKSRNSVFKLVNKLADLHYLEKDSSGRIIPGRLFHAVKILGIVEAGFPSAAEEELIDTISIDEFLISNKEATYMLKVSGDSMKDAGILPGDIVLVERGLEAKDGDIAIAKVDGEWTMKYFRKTGGKAYLEPANEKYKPIHPRESLVIAAVVRAVIRKYRC
ncbi:MAG: translesion error-prone DNA polymerase V autoproteolytic subunit [Candidatus Riflebacteria bacterium]|nr:translesion error-prone DNA polymerase V autoproteolytic subunit [Candidatus Riflebacteria bacterium]